jgi:hypothetical protein
VLASGAPWDGGRSLVIGQVLRLLGRRRIIAAPAR